MSFFGLWIGSKEGLNEANPRKDAKGRQKITSKGTEKPLLGATQYFFLVRGRQGRYYVSQKMYEKHEGGDWLRFI